MEDRKLYSLPKAAERVGIPEATLRRAAQEGKLHATKIGNSWAVTLEDIATWNAARKPTKRGRPRKSD